MKTTLVILLYIFLFYLSFLSSANSILGSSSAYQRMNVTISTVNYEITVSNSNTFYTSFNLTDRSLTSLVAMGCFINQYGSSPTDYTATAQANSYNYYVVFSIITMGTPSPTQSLSCC